MLKEHALHLGDRQESLLIMLQGNEGFRSDAQVVCTEGSNSTSKGQKHFERELMLPYRLRGLEIVCQTNYVRERSFHCEQTQVS